jgi:pyruvate/2-oxoglutarate dehydrogenase complex dihydrolipoamide acyltransferase (E2) component
MTLRQTIQAAPANVNELIGKLANTSNQAVKTREGLFGELKSELALYVDVEEQHLLPLLRKHPETKALASDAAKGNKELRAQLSALETMPKDTDEFLAKVVELKKSLQQYVTNERNELLPAVLKMLSDEEASETAKKMETAVADAEEAKRTEKRAEAAKAKHEAAEAQQAKEDEQAAGRAAKSAERATRQATKEAADTFQKASNTVQDGARQVTQRMVETTTKAVSSTRDALKIYRDSSENLLEDLRAITTSSAVSSKAGSEFGSAWREWVRNAATVNMNASRKMMQCKTFADVAATQREYVETSMRTWMESRSAVLQIAQRASKQALSPLQARIETAA